MKTRLYMLAKNVPHPQAAGQTTRVFYNGWKLHTNIWAPFCGVPNPDGCRTAILFSSQALLDKALGDMPADFRKGLYVVDAIIEEV